MAIRTIDGVILDTYENKYSIMITKACFTCEHNAGGGDTRGCRNKESEFNGKEVAKTHCCEQWKVKIGFENAGKGGGDVHRLDYLRAVLDDATSSIADPDRTAWIASLRKSGDHIIKNF